MSSYGSLAQSMKSLTLIIFLNFQSLSAFAGSTLACSHPELCKMAKLIAEENKIADFKTQSLVSISGDPHEYEPSTAEIKNLISAPLLITGPNELNPWIKKINFQRSKSPVNKTISILLDGLDLSSYPKASGEALSHFWLYPKVYCSLKAKLEIELSKQNFKISKHNCDFKSVEQKLRDAIGKINRPIILTHDALLPLLMNLDQKATHEIVAIKGSGHHEETGPQSIKKMYDAMKAPQVVWIKEQNINIPTNILDKIRPVDLTIQIDTASSSDKNPFSALNELAEKLSALAEKKR